MIRPFTTEDFARRMERATAQAADAGLTGILVTPGPDLVYFTGYRPTAITERITLPALQASREPAMIVPVLERHDAEPAPGVAAVSQVDWADGSDPYAATATLLDPRGRYAISDSAWAMHVLALQEVLPESRYVSMTGALPMLRAVKDADELERLAAAGASADATFERIVKARFAGRRERDVGTDLADLLREYGHSEVDFTIVGSGPNGANPHHEMSQRTINEGEMVILDFGGIQDGYGSDTPAPCTWESRATRNARCSTSSGVPSRRPSTRCGRGSPARRSTAPPGR
jgi:Xaa-Pro aminopeptidase